MEFIQWFGTATRLNCVVRGSNPLSLHYVFDTLHFSFFFVLFFDFFFGGSNPLSLHYSALLFLFLFFFFFFFVLFFESDVFLGVMLNMTCEMSFHTQTG